MTDDEITAIWDSLDAEAFDAATLIRFARAIEAKLAPRAQPAEPKHYRMKLETGHMGVKMLPGPDQAQNKPAGWDSGPLKLVVGKA